MEDRVRPGGLASRSRRSQRTAGVLGSFRLVAVIADAGLSGGLVWSGMGLLQATLLALGLLIVPELVVRAVLAQHLASVR
ncbi:hypothetical protein ACFV1L_24415 [Kitasatospora sp. NPDC059646]|uniref:hypothetical protein n=1 Tax=Kitasatospora sp. NPDC059646 TaxID=3346893 RepID=UPI0036973F02